MSRIGKKVIPLPAGVKYKVEGNTVLVEGPKGKVSALIAEGISLETKDGALHVNREGDKYAAVHGLTRALVFNAVHGVTAGWKKELDIVGIGYRAELKGKGTVVFTLGYSHPLSFRCPRALKPRSTPSRRTSPSAASTGRRWARWRPTCARCASPTRTRTRACATPTRS
jgi:large subunit ribosomal protein L6